MTNCYHASSGGIRTFYRALLDAANRHAREIRLVVPGPQDSIECIGKFGKIYTIRAPESPFIDSKYHLLLPHLYALPYRSKLRRILEEEQPDLVEVCDKYTLCYLPSVVRNGWMESAPQAVFVGLSCERMDDNVSAFISASQVGRRFSNWYMRKIYAPRFDCHISNSQYTAEELMQALAGRPEVPVHVCAMGADCENFGPHLRDSEKRRALLSAIAGGYSATERTKLLLYAGRISPEKNIALLFEMMGRLADDPEFDYRLIVAGAGQLSGWFEEHSELQAAGRVHLLGHIADRRRLAEIFANADAMIHPNPREPFGIAPLEAMASGLPVVAPFSGGVLSYANEHNAWLANADGQSFARAVRRVFENEIARKSKVKLAMETARQFSWPAATARFFNLYDDLYARLRDTQPAERAISRPS
jgi:alpha-1,6-mannosyltransferase